MDKKYFIFVGDEKIEVDKEIYQNYWQITNRERYLERLDRENKLLFFSDLSRDYSFAESVADEDYDLEKIVETHLMIQAVRRAIAELSEEEREIVYRLFYAEESMTSIAKTKRVTPQALYSRRNTILKKLRALLKDFE